LKYYDREKSKRLKGYELTLPELACFHSHYLLWVKCFKSNKPMLVLEDNVDIHDDFYTLYKEIFAMFDGDLSYENLVKLSASKNKKIKPIKKLESKDGYFLGKYVSPTTSAMGYIITPLVARELIGNIKGFINPVDDYMEKTWIHRFKVHSVFPSLICRSDLVSDIGKERKKKVSLTFLNKLNIEIFRLKEKFQCFIFW
jgi:glycosyl transferase family 25